MKGNLVLVDGRLVSGRGSGFQATHLLLQFLDDGLRVFEKDALMDVLWAVDVPRLDGEENGAFDLAGIVLVREMFEQFGIIFDNFRSAPDLDTAAVGVPSGR